MKRVSGFSAVEVLIVITLVVLVGLVGYNVYSMNVARNNSTTEQQAIADQTPEAPEINNESDLDTAAQTLDAVDIDESNNDLQQLDSETAF